MIVTEGQCRRYVYDSVQLSQHNTAVVYLQLNTEHGAVHSSTGAGARAGAAVILPQRNHLELR